MAIVEIPLYGLLPLERSPAPEICPNCSSMVKDHICPNCNEEQLESGEFIHNLPLKKSKSPSLYDIIVICDNCDNCDNCYNCGSEWNQNYTCVSCVEEQFQNDEMPSPPTLVRQNAKYWSSHEELEKDLFGDKFCNRCHKCHKCQ
jgi:hypothetical protein